MVTPQLSVGPHASVARASHTWAGLYRAGALSAALYVLLIVVPIGLIYMAPQPQLTGGAAVLEYIADYKVVYLVEYVSFVGLSLPAIVVFLALYIALHSHSRSLAALGATFGIASEILALAYNSSPPSLNGGLLYLSDQYVTASATQRAALASAAEALIAVSNAVNAAGIVTALGILFVSLAMRRSRFGSGVAYLGSVTGTLGIVCEALRDQLGAGYLLYGLLLPLWFSAVGWKLFRLSRAATE